jgi:hypothetical protein
MRDLRREYVGISAVDEDKDTRREIAALPAGSMTGLTRDTPGYQAFKARLRSLPQTPTPAGGR